MLGLKGQGHPGQGQTGSRLDWVPETRNPTPLNGSRGVLRRLLPKATPPPPDSPYPPVTRTPYPIPHPQCCHCHHTRLGHILVPEWGPHFFMASLQAWASVWTSPLCRGYQLVSCIIKLPVFCQLQARCTQWWPNTVQRIHIDWIQGYSMAPITNYEHLPNRARNTYPKPCVCVVRLLYS